jgi:hypothetical protein
MTGEVLMFSNALRSLSLDRSKLRQKRACIYVFLKGKLMPLDNSLPFLVAVRENYPLFKITIISSDQKFADMIMGERLIMQSLKKFRITINSPPTGEKKFGKLLRLIVLAISMVVDSLRHPLFIINSSQLKKGKRFFELLMTINKVINGGKLVELKLIPTTVKVDRFFREIMNSQYGRTIEKKTIAQCDVAISSLPRSEYRQCLATEFVEVGYGRGFESWFKHIDKSLTNIEPEITDDFIFWPLSVLQRSENFENIDLREIIVETIRLILKSGIKSQIVFRYHPTTDQSEFQKIISDTGIKNFFISNSHPHQLIKKCRFVFSNTGTSLFCDALFFRKRVVQYSSMASTYCIRDHSGRPMGSIYQPVVTDFFNEKTAFRKFLMDFGRRGYLPESSSENDRNEFVMISCEDERKLFNHIFGF